MIQVLHVMDKLSVDGSRIHGVTRALSWWLPRMDRNQFSFSVCSLRQQEEAARFFEDEGVRVCFLNRGKFDVRTLFDLIKIIRKEQPDLLHLHGYGATNLGRIAGALLGIPRIVHEHTVIADQPLYQTVADSLLRGLTTRAVAISPVVRTFMVERRKIAREKIDCFFYGIPLEDFTPSEDSVIDRKREELGITPEQHVVCCVGRLDRQKGQKYLLSAARQVVGQIPGVIFVLVGDGPHRSVLQERRDRLGLDTSVIFAGHRDDVPDLLKMSDVVAIPSLWEGGPITLFEAMSVGKPVVGTPVGLMPDVIEEGRTGYLVPAMQAEPLANRLAEILSQPELAERMGREAYSAVQEYKMANAVQQLSEFYRGI